MKQAIALLFAVWLGLSGLVSTADAVSVSIGIGDRPYYSHGPYYYVGPTRYVWIPGHYRWHRHHRVWIHGFYTARY